MPILKQDRNSTHHGGIGFPRIIVLAASLDQNNGTIATKKCKRLLSPRHGTVQTLRHVMFHVFSYGHLHVLQVLPLRMFSWTVETAISSPNGLVVHGQGCQNFDLNTCQRNKRAPGVPVHNANQISGFTVPRLVGTSQEKATLSPSDTAIGLDVLPFISVWEICVGVQSVATCGNSKSQQNTSRTSMWTKWFSHTSVIIRREN